jgi:hypothetical protein
MAANSCLLFAVYVASTDSYYRGALLTLPDRIDRGVGGLSQQLATCHAEIVAEIMATVSHIPRGVYEAMFVVISPTGISIPISLTLCVSYEVRGRPRTVLLLSALLGPRCHSHDVYA